MDYSVVSMHAGGRRFEVLTAPGALSAYREGRLPLPSALFQSRPVVWSGRHTSGVKASPADLQHAFGTTSEADCIKRLLDEGSEAADAAGGAGDVKGYIDANYWELPMPKVL
eukprot:m51a1_g1645 hypothetical protein (112) ;mRNA; r:333759-334094